MNCPNINDLTNELKELINLTSLPLERKASIYNWCYDFLTKLNSSIQRLEDPNDPQIVKIKKIKKNKTALDTHIKSLKNSEEYLLSIGDKETADILRFDRQIFEVFQKNSTLAFNLFSHANSTILALPDATYNLEWLKKKEHLDDVDKFFITNTEQFLRIVKLSHYFEGFDVTSKMLVTSASIYLFRTFISFPDVQKYRLKEKLEYLLNHYVESIQIRPDEMEKTYLKSVFNNFPVFSYPTDTNRRPLYDLSLAETRLQKLGSSGTSRQYAILKKFFEGQYRELKVNLFSEPRGIPK